MKQPRFGPLLVALALLLALFLVPAQLFSRWMAPESIQRISAAENSAKYKNVFLLQSAFVKESEGTLPFIGSSTIGIYSRYHPANYFNPQVLLPYLDWEPALTGIMHVLTLSAAGGAMTGKSFVYVLDPNDFTYNGMGEQVFDRYFTPYKAYAFLFNSSLSIEHKRKIALQLLHYDSILSDPVLKMEIADCANPNYPKHWEAVAKRPLAYLKYKILEKQDFFQAFSVPDKIKPYTPQQVDRYVSYQELWQEASQEGASMTSSNKFGFPNDIYKRTIEPHFSLDKNSWKPGVYLQATAEFEVLDGLLDLAQAYHAKPMFILFPRKGAWSDYIGFTQNYRNALYDKIETAVERRGFQVVDLREYEYDRYFMRDPNHLGWTGWVKLDEVLTEAFVKKHLH